MDWWGGSGFGDWFWNVAMDGILTTTIATGVAASLVLRTLRHDRWVVQESTFGADCRRLLSGARRFRTGTRIDGSEVGPWVDDLEALALSVPADDPQFRRILDFVVAAVAPRRPVLRGGGDFPDVTYRLDFLEGALRQRIANPNFYRSIDAQRVSEVLAAVETGTSSERPWE